LGGMLAGAVLPVLLQFWSWQIAALSVAVCCFAFAILTQIIREDFDDDRDETAPVTPAAAVRPLNDLLSTPGLRSIGLSSFFFGAMQLCLTTFLVLYLTESQDMSIVAAGSLLAVAQVAGVVGRLLWGWVADRLVAPRTLLGILGLLMGFSAVA